MTDKKWYENIPENGVLCRYLGCDGSHFVHIKDRTDLNEFCLDYGLNDEDIKPIAPNEFWQFAPWQDLKDAPAKQEILVEFVIDSEKFIIQVSKIDNEFYNHLGQEITANPIKWLPLPEESQ